MTASFTDRRALLGAGALIAGAGALATSADAKPAGGKGWKATPEPQDAWLDKPGTRHRLAFDTTDVASASEAILYANNFYAANQSGYGIAADALGVVIVLRHFSTPFAYGDLVWQSHGAKFARMIGLDGDPVTNPKMASAAKLPNGEPMPTLASLAAKGTRFAVCGMATKLFAGMFAKDSGKTPAQVEAELVASLISGAVMAPAGIVAINRAQEHGYTFA